MWFTADNCPPRDRIENDSFTRAEKVFFSRLDIDNESPRIGYAGHCFAYRCETYAYIITIVIIIYYYYRYYDYDYYCYYYDHC
jgi:hypothetical protein